MSTTIIDLRTNPGSSTMTVQNFGQDLNQVIIIHDAGSLAFEVEGYVSLITMQNIAEELEENDTYKTLGNLPVPNLVASLNKAIEEAEERKNFFNNLGNFQTKQEKPYTRPFKGFDGSKDTDDVAFQVEDNED